MTAENDCIPAGTILADRYQVRRELGRGGMGVVYLCRDLVTDERVALKLLSQPGALVKPEEAWWFHEEARALAGLSHPVLVRARDFGTTREGLPYLAMDAVPGRSLHEWIYFSQTDGPLPWPIIWLTVDSVLGALAHAHARAVIHGDLKPSNVLLEIPDDGSEPEVHVLDLGLAWLMQDRVDHRLDGSTAAEPTVRWGAGTPGWMAPEQIRFATPHIGPSTDLYALGCILYALLTTREPYTGTNEELLEQHRNAPIPEVTPLPEGTPPEVATFVKRLLAKRPWQRYEFAGDARRLWRAWKPRPDAATATPLPRVVPTGQPVAPRREEITRPDALLTEVPSAPSIATGLLGLRPSPFVARQAERTRLLTHVADVIEACAPGTGPATVAPPRHRFVLVSGEAGVGKSRLADWLCEEVHERALMVPLRARYRKIAAPLDGMLGAITQHYRIERAERDVVERVLMNHWGVHAGDDEGTTWIAATTEWLCQETGDPGKVGPSGKRFALDRPELRWLVIRRVLDHIGRDKPLLLWLDDLHHAAPTTFEGLARLHAEAPDLGLVVVATVRSEAVEADPLAATRLDNLVRDWGGERMRLAPLDGPEAHSLLRETLPLDDDAIVEAAARSKGNPLFALQILHAWAMTGGLELRGGRYFVPSASLAAKPKTTSELWEERLAAMPGAMRDAALAAAALGGDIRREVLHRELATLGLDPDRSMIAMKRAQVLLASGADRLRWPHALLQEHLLGQLVQRDNAPRVFHAAADALAHHPLASSRRVVRHRVVCLVRASAIEEAANLLHGSIAESWARTRDPAATLRDLALLDGKLDGALAAMHLRWRGEALRHAGKFEEARRDAEEARRIWSSTGDLENEAASLRLLGHIASEMAAPAQGRRLVARALALYEELEHDDGRAECEVTLGEIDYLLGDHGRARAELAAASARFRAAGNRLGRAQCLILQSFVEQAGGSSAVARELLRTARAEFEGLGNRLGVAQSDVALAHAEHREGNLEAAHGIALAARQAFRDLAVPRGEAAAERMLAMATLDAGDGAAAAEHASGAATIYDRLADPWGQVETRLLRAQIALDRGDADAARDELIACQAVALAEAEPKQHRHLTLAWLAYHEGRFVDAGRELDMARAAFKDAGRTGDHTPELLKRFAAMQWPKPANGKVASWLRAIEAAARGLAPREGLSTSPS
jgi:serine/threonine protein kinase/tetratricopeptide (TPR) repeat protein